MQARKEGRLADARRAFHEMFEIEAEQPDALQQLGELAYAQGELAQAEDMLTRVLRANPTLAPAWSRLGEVREDLGRCADAQECYRRAVELKPGYIEAHFNRARLLHQLGRADEAAQCLIQALRLKPGSPTLLAQMLQLRALLQKDAGELDQALATLDQAVEVAPARAALHHNRGVLLQLLSRSALALSAHDHAIRLGLDVADAHYNRGNSLQSLGRSADALGAYRTALVRDPQHALALYDTARLRWRLGDTNFSAELDAAAAAAPGSALAHGIKARLLLRAEHYADAAAAFAQAAALDRTAAGYPDGLGQALARLGRTEEALAAHHRAVELAPQQAAVHVNRASCLLQAGQVALAAQVAETAVRLDPLGQQAWATLGLAWRASDSVHDTWLNDYGQYVQVYDLAAPEGWADATAFNRALAGVLEQMHTDAQAPIDQTLRHGSQTLGDIFEQPQPLLVQVKARIAQAVDHYIAHLDALPRDDSHPLLGRTSPHWRFSDSWSSRLRSGGFHTQHVHPHGWISSCYYVALPPAITSAGTDGTPGAGWITFGAPDIVVPGHPLGARRAERPQVGRLVLFPSFMWHGTVPFTDVQPRLTLAFDVLPLD